MDYKLEHVKGIGPKNIYHLRNQNIWSPYDLVMHIPSSYEDFSFTPKSQIKHKEVVTLQGKVISDLKHIVYKKGELVSFKLQSFDKMFDVVAFGKGYLIKTIQKEDEVIVKGTYDFFKHQVSASSIIKPEKKKEIQPVYQLNHLADRTVSAIITNIFQDEQFKIFENIPANLLSKHQLIGRFDALYNLHFPSSFHHIDQAIKRMKYEEAFFLQLKLAAKKFHEIKREPKTYDIEKVKTFISTIPYELTDDQKQATNDIFRDFKKPNASYRLIQGDVGSGKTIVSMIASFAVVTASEQVAIMAPTELLANQHYQSFTRMMPQVKIALLTSKTKQKQIMKQAIENHEYDIIIGTHALIQEDVKFNRLGLVIIDEQHKFGVTSRDELIQKAMSKDVIYLTATPIPRTLALLAYGKSHVSLIKEKPQERERVETHYLVTQQINELYEAMRSAIKRQEHIYVVVPAINSQKVNDNIETTYAMLKENFNCPIFVLHGKQKSDEQTTMMDQFMYTPGSILLSTTMIEVGIDIPTATLIAILSAEHFGLSQLHQLRGRVGRSHLKSQCFLVSEKDDIDRLSLLSNEHDGFILSEYDLIERGPGDFLGEQQSGFLQFKFIDLLQDQDVIEHAQIDVNELIHQPDFLTNTKYKYLNRFMKDA